MSKLTVTVTGGEPQQPEIIKCRSPVSNELHKRLNALNGNTPYLLHAQVGAGKTYAIVHELLPWAIKRGLKILYVSSRCAINEQVKREIVTVTGEAHLIAEHTAVGLRSQRDFMGITVITYHALYALMLNEPETLKDYDVLVFDEIHTLIEDADFVPYTAYVLYHLKNFFGGKIRIYMSATPDSILPCLLKAEAPYQLTILRFPKSFSYVEPRFFHDFSEIVDLINKDRSSRKWLIFVPSIKEGEHLSAQLSCSVCLLNSEYRNNNEAQWEEILSKRAFSEKVAIVTAIVDAGVSFEDRALSNIVTFTPSLTTLVQVLGRKRRKGNETVRLFVWCPDSRDVKKTLYTKTQILDALTSVDTEYNTFLERHILRPENNRDLRRFVRADFDGKLHVNSLAKAKLALENNFLRSLLKKGERQCSVNFAKSVANCLMLRNLDYDSCWINSATQEAQHALTDLLATSAGHSMPEAEFSNFATAFRDAWVEAYGTGKGGKNRKDRAWGADKISSMLVEQGEQYRLHTNRAKSTHLIVDTYAVEEGPND